MSNIATVKYGLPRKIRLIKSDHFGELIKTRNTKSFRGYSAFFCVNGLFRDNVGQLRIGFTVGKRNSPRSVDRALVKRILREAARMQAPQLRSQLCECGMGLDVSLRLICPIKNICSQKGVTELKKALRADADKLMADILSRMSKIASEGSSCSHD